jgi:hypothetical protein
MSVYVRPPVGGPVGVIVTNASPARMPKTQALSGAAWVSPPAPWSGQD